MARSKMEHSDADGVPDVDGTSVTVEHEAQSATPASGDAARMASEPTSESAVPAQLDAAADKVASDLRASQVSSTIKSYVIGAMGAALIAVPVLDLAALLGIQLKLIHRLTGMYGLKFNERMTKALVLSLIGSVLPVTVGMAVASSVKFVPGLGTLLGVASVSVLGGALTYAIGRTFAQHFEKGGTLLNADIASMKRVFKREYKTGKRVAHEAEHATASSPAA